MLLPSYTTELSSFALAMWFWFKMQEVSLGKVQMLCIFFSPIFFSFNWQMNNGKGSENDN